MNLGDAFSNEPITGRRLVTACVFLGGMLSLTAALHSNLGSAGDYKAAFLLDDATREKINSSPFALILGELRVTAADVMWVKTERYMHRGVSYRPHISAEALASSGEVVVKENAAEENHADETPLVPNREKDYRGFVGTIQRAIEPYNTPDTPHKHESGDELIPWYRILTLSNPHHTRGYLTGSWWLMKQAKHQDGAMGEALRFIDEGVKNNPDNFQLLLMKGRILLTQEKPAEAIEVFRKAAQLALKIRPEGGKEQPPTWTYWEEEDFESAVHYVPTLIYQKLHDRAKAEAELAWAMKLLPDSGRLQQLQDELKKSAIPATQLSN